MEGNEMAKSNAVSREIHAPTTGEERTKMIELSLIHI